MGSFVVSPPIERRHTRQRIAEKPGRQIARLELGSAVTIRQRQGTGPNARREHEMSGLAAASSFIQNFGHCSFPPYGLPKPQPYGTPAPWPKGDGRPAELGPNTGISMKTHTHFAYRVDMWGDVDETFIEHLVGIEDLECARCPDTDRGITHHVAMSPRSRARSLRAAHIQFDAGGGRMTLRAIELTTVSRRLLSVASRKAAYAQGKQARTAE